MERNHLAAGLKRASLIVVLALVVGVLGVGLVRTKGTTPPRVYGASVPTPSGTGFAHVTGGHFDTASRAVNISNSDVTGSLPVASIAPGSNGQVLQTTGGAAAWGSLSATTTTGLISTRSAASGSAKLFLSQDQQSLGFDDPSTTAWKNFATEYFVTPATTSSYTVVGSVALTQKGDLIKANNTANGVSNGACAMVSSASLGSTSAWMVTLVALWNPLFGQQYPEIGVAVSAGVSLGSSSARAMAVFNNNASTGLHQIVFAIGGTRSSVGNDNSVPMASGGARVHLRLLNDGTVLHYQVGNMGSGGQWQDWFSENSPSSLDHYGFLLGNEFGSGNSYNQALILENNLSTSVAQQAVTGATGNGVPVVLNVASDTKFDVGDLVAVHAMAGNTALNTTSGSGALSGAGQIITAIDRSAHTLTFGLVTGNGTWTSGGVVTNLTQ